MDINSFRKVGNYEISDLCFETFPCQHFIKLKNGNTELISGDEIYRIFKSEGLSDPHIDTYAEYVRQRDLPMP